LYLLADAADLETIRAAERHGFNLVDVRVQLQREITGHNDERAPMAAVRPATAGDLPALAAIARVSHDATRFYVDQHFDRERVADLYARWIERSIAGELAEAVWVVEADNRPAGYVTLQALPNATQIGLIAVDARERGRGLGGQLIAASRRWSARQGRPLLTVVTQGRAAGALRFYEREGFRTQSVHFWYHRWFGANDRDRSDR
jgi:GNAT superfamily N-acetyltransferase